MGKYFDNYTVDKEKCVHTLPVLLRDKTGRYLNQFLLISFYILTFYMVITDMLGIGVLLVIFALPRIWTVLKIHNTPKQADPPEDWSVWPLWLVGWSFLHNKLAGGLFILGLLINLVLPIDYLYFSNFIRF